MKIYERPSVEIKKFDVEDIILVSTQTIDVASTSSELQAMTDNTAATGVVFKW